MNASSRKTPEGEVPESVIGQRIEGRVLIATLSRPEAHNGIDENMAKALEALAARLSQSTDIDALILTGQGRVFCAGGDVAAFKAALSAADGGNALPALLDGLATRVHAALERIVSAGPLLVAAVNGPATGAGLGLICACDVAIARPAATLRAGFSRLGFSPDTATTYFLPRLIGYRKALHLLLSGDAVTAESALQLGIYSELIDADDADFIAQVLAKTNALIASGAAVRSTRGLLKESESASLHVQLQREQESLVALAAQANVSAHIRKALGIK